MKTIKLFLTSSLMSDMEHDINELGAFVDDLNDRYESNDVYFKLHISGEGDNEDDLIAAENSELFYIIFHDEPQAQAKAEFDIAYKHFTETKKPKIVTYFKQIDENGSTIAFLDKLGNQLGHFYSYYTHMDTIKLNFLMQLKTLGLEQINVEMDKSAVTIDGKPVASINAGNIPMFANNKSLETLKSELSTIETEFWSLREKNKQNPDDDDVMMAMLSVGSKRSKLNEAIKELQLNILKVSSSFLEKDSSGKFLSKRHIYARLCLENGDIESAIEALSEEEMELDEAAEQQKVIEEKKERQAKVDDRLLKVDALKLQINNPDRFEEIERNYEKAIQLEKDWGLPRLSMRLYAQYLQEQNDFEECIRYAKLFLHWLESDEVSEVLVADTYNLIAMCYNSLREYAEAEPMFKKVIELEQNFDNERNLARSYHNLASVYLAQNKYNDAVELFEAAITILEKLAYTSPTEFSLILSKCYNSLGGLYVTYQGYEKAKIYLQKTLDILERLEVEKPGANQKSLAIAYNNLASLYGKMDEIESSIDMMNRAYAIFESLARENPLAYEPLFANCGNNLGYLYRQIAETETAETLHLKSYEILERYASINPKAFEAELASSCNSLGALYIDKSDFTAAETYLKKAETIYEKLGMLDSMGMTYFMLGKAYLNCENMASAEMYFEKMIATVQQLYENQPSLYIMGYAYHCSQIAEIYEEMELFEKAEVLYRREIDLLENSDKEINEMLIEKYEYMIEFLKSVGKNEDIPHFEDKIKRL
jgi:tetratricopeptide (TPR) repeat protein